LRTSANPLAQVVRRNNKIEDVAIDGFAAPMSQRLAVQIYIATYQRIPTSMDMSITL